MKAALSNPTKIFFHSSFSRTTDWNGEQLIAAMSMSREPKKDAGTLHIQNNEPAADESHAESEDMMPTAKSNRGHDVAEEKFVDICQPSHNTYLHHSGMADRNGDERYECFSCHSFKQCQNPKYTLFCIKVSAAHQENHRFPQYALARLAP